MQAPAGRGCQQRRVTAGLETAAALRHDRRARFGAREAMMTTGISRRQFHTALGWGATSIALAELGLSGPARAEENFTIASTGASWGEGLKAAFIDAPKFEEKGGKVTQEFAIDSVFTAKAMASCGT